VRLWTEKERGGSSGVAYSLKHLAMNARADFFPVLAFCSVFCFFFFFFLLSSVPAPARSKKSETKEERKAKLRGKASTDGAMLS
jgi:hypothetical protein